jgi:hypothetical protein
LDVFSTGFISVRQIIFQIARALAASIAANGMLQSPVVEPETQKGKPTGFYLVTIGEGPCPADAGIGEGGYVHHARR